MRKLPIILTLLLAAAWGYTSWYWYTCNIKGFCGEGKISNTQTSILSYDDVVSEEDIDEEPIDPLSSQGAPRLWSDDVLSESPENNDEQEKPEINTSTGVIIEIWNSNSGALSGSWGEDGEVSSEDWEDNLLLCSEALVWPLAFGWENPSSEMKKLEEFLLLEFSREADISVDGIFGQWDFDLVKKLQLKYKEQMLDPWNISQPTWYVWSTTVSTINSIASCN